MSRQRASGPMRLGRCTTPSAPLKAGWGQLSYMSNNYAAKVLAEIRLR